MSEDKGKGPIGKIPKAVKVHLNSHDKIMTYSDFEGGGLRRI